jgi:hypothetical protein
VGATPVRASSSCRRRARKSTRRARSRPGTRRRPTPGRACRLRLDQPGLGNWRCDHRPSLHADPPGGARAHAPGPGSGRANGDPALDATGLRPTNSGGCRQAESYPGGGELEHGAHVVEREGRIPVVGLDPMLRAVCELSVSRASHLEALQALNGLFQDAKVQRLRPGGRNLLVCMKKFEIILVCHCVHVRTKVSPQGETRCARRCEGGAREGLDSRASVGSTLRRRRISWDDSSLSPNRCSHRKDVAPLVKQTRTFARDR